MRSSLLSTAAPRRKRRASVARRPLRSGAMNDPPSWDVVEREELQDCAVFRVTRHLSRSPRTGTLHPFYGIEADPWVNVVPVTPSGEIVMVRQWRHGSGEVTLEIPGGMIGSVPRLLVELDRLALALEIPPNLAAGLRRALGGSRRSANHRENLATLWPRVVRLRDASRSVPARDRRARRAGVHIASRAMVGALSASARSKAPPTALWRLQPCHCLPRWSPPNLQDLPPRPCLA